VLTTAYRAVLRSAGRGMGVNHLDGTLPAELSKLTDLEALCAALRRCCRAAHRRTGRRRAYTHAVVRSDCERNKLSGTIGGWIGSMAKLTLLSAPRSQPGAGCWM
jgi:hypothetical protein